MKFNLDKVEGRKWAIPDPSEVALPLKEQVYSFLDPALLLDKKMAVTARSAFQQLLLVSK